MTLDTEPPHFARLIEGALRQLRDDLIAAADGEFAGLRSSHFRLLELIPVDGARPTELADRAGMTKQALGQFVEYLQDLGYVDSAPDPADRRARIVRRTARGDAANKLSQAVIADRERKWRELVGTSRYATFRRVLTEIARDVGVL